MQILMDHGFSFFNHFDYNGIINYFSGYDTGDDCCCGACCSCGSHKMVIDLSGGVILMIIFSIYNRIQKIVGITHRGHVEYLKKPKKADVPLAWGLYFQDGASPSFEGIVDLHNRIMFYLVVILFGVTWILLSIIWNYNKSGNKLVYRHLNHGTLIELIWTVGPALVLVAIAFPSFKLLYLMDKSLCPYL